VHVGGDFTRDASGARVGGSPFKKGVDLPGSRHVSLLLRPLRPFAFRASIWGAPVFSGEIHVLSSSCCWRACAHGGVTSLVFFLLLLEGCNPMGVVILPPSFGFKDFHHVARLQSPAGGHPRG
jgi:hypothetical protein